MVITPLRRCVQVVSSALRGARWLLGVLLLLGALLLLSLRYWILPDIERYHADITAAASAALKRTVTIEHIEADWDGLRPRLTLTDVKILDEHGQAALQFPRMRNTLAWTSLFVSEVRFYSVELDRPNLLVRQDKQGHLYVAGILSEAQSGAQSETDNLDWLLQQSHILVHQGKVVWLDEKRGATPISFEQVELAIENRGKRHRFAVQATPPTALSSRLDVRGNLLGTSLDDMRNWRGELFAQVEQLDALAWSYWFTLPAEFKRGKGAMRVWLGVESGAVNQVTADVALQTVQTQLAVDLPQLELSSLRGRVAWKQLENGFEVSAQQLALLMPNGFEIKPTNFLLAITPARGYQSASGELNANTLNLADINALLGYLPMAADVKQRLLALAPQGRIENLKANWQGDESHLTRYQISAKFDDLSLRQVGTQPGFSGLSGVVAGSESDGTLQLNSRKFNVQAPNFLSEPLTFDSLTARLDWQRNSSGWELKLNNTQVHNEDVEGTLQGSYQINDGPGVADLTLDLSRANVKHTARYIPKVAFNEATYRWLQTGLQEGVADSFRMRVRGDLREFPFADSKNGLFKLEAKANNVAIEFASGWPRIERAQTQLLIQGTRLEVLASSAITAGAALRKVSVVFPNLLADNVVMQVSGEAADTTQHCLDYIRKSPVRGYLDGYTDDIHATGTGLLKLKLDIPLDGVSPALVAGNYQFSNNEVDISEHVPLLKNASGLLTFSNDALNATDITAQILGGPARLSLRSDKGTLLANAEGTLDVDSLGSTYAYPLLKKLHGKADWVTHVKVKNKLADVLVTSDLRGMTSLLPQPFAKAAGERVALRFEQKNLNSKQSLTGVDYGDIVHADMTRTLNAQGNWDTKQGEIQFGKSAPHVRKDGIWLEGELAQLSLEGWNGWSDFPSGGGVLPNIAGINVTIDKLHGYGNVVRALSIRGSGRNGLISTRLSSREVNGDLIWQPQDEGRLLVRLKNAMLGEGMSTTTPAPVAQQIAFAPAEKYDLPVIDVEVEKLTWKGRQLGRLEMLVSSLDGDIMLQRLRLANPDTTISATGKWQANPEQTFFNTEIEFINAGKALLRYGFEESVKDGSGLLQGDVVWMGGADEFNYGSLNGAVHLKMGKGRFLKVNPGAAKLLGVMSLQSLPKRISLDFTDVISPGFEFDSIKGEAVIEHGLLKTNDFDMVGAAAKISMKGQIELERETQNLKVRVMPSIGANVSLLSFAAGPAIGVSVLLANKILDDPLDKLVAFDYNISGSWEDPKVERVGVVKQAPVAVEAGENWNNKSSKIRE